MKQVQQGFTRRCVCVGGRGLSLENRSRNVGEVPVWPPRGLNLCSLVFRLKPEGPGGWEEWPELSLHACENTHQTHETFKCMCVAFPVQTASLLHLHAFFLSTHKLIWNLHADKLKSSSWGSIKELIYYILQNWNTKYRGEIIQIRTIKATQMTLSLNQPWYLKVCKSYILRHQICQITVTSETNLSMIIHHPAALKTCCFANIFS